MNVGELYPAHTSPVRGRRARGGMTGTDNPPPLPPHIHRKPATATSSPHQVLVQYSSDNNSSAPFGHHEHEVTQVTRRKPTVDYSRKPIIEDPTPQPTESHHQTGETSTNGRNHHPPEPQARNVRRPPPPRPDKTSTHLPPHREYEEIGAPLANHSEGNIRGRYNEIRGNRGSDADISTHSGESPAYRAEEDAVEGRRFRQMQPVPYQYYIDHAGDGPRDRALSGRGSDSNLVKDRSSSNRSFASLSSSESQEDKNVPIRIPSRRHLSSDSPSDPPTPVAPMSLRDASRLMPQGLVNPSYRVATMADMMPSSGASHPPTSRGGMRPTPSRRQGGLPGHVRQGIVQGV